MLTYWIRPAAAALFWMILTGSTLAEIATIWRADFRVNIRRSSHKRSRC